MTSTRPPTKPRGRPRDPAVSGALTAAALRLLTEQGFARMSMEAIAAEAGVGKPAIYRRFRNKAELVVAAISERLPVLEAPELGDTEAELRAVLASALPTDGPGYVGLIGGLMAEHRRHPELIEAYRKRILLPRRAIGRQAIERGQARGDIRPDVDPEVAIDLFAGEFLARVFAGRDTGPGWRKRAFALWWSTVRTGDDDAGRHKLTTRKEPKR